VKENEWLKNANRWYINMVGDIHTLSESDTEYEDEDKGAYSTYVKFLR
jgi:hypothetical protein